MHHTRLRLQLTALEHATRPGDMNAAGWGFHALTGNRSGVYAVLVSGNWRLTFRFEATDATDVGYEDYH